VEFARIKRKRLFVLGFALLAATFAVLLVLSIPTKYSRRSQRLPDGSSLKIVSISYGTNHSFAWPQRKPWESFLVQHLPRSLTARLGWQTTSGSVGMSSRPGETSIVIFTLQEPVKSESVKSEFFHPHLKVALCDEGGTVYDSAFGSSQLGGYRGKHRWRVVGWQFSKIPRDSRYLRLEFSEQSADGSTPQQVAEFLIPNPAMNAGTNSSR
jgi:hypothetical protein